MAVDTWPNFSEGTTCCMPDKHSLRSLGEKGEILPFLLVSQCSKLCTKIAILLEHVEAVTSIVINISSTINDTQEESRKLNVSRGVEAAPPGGQAVLYPHWHSICWFGALLDVKGA